MGSSKKHKGEKYENKRSQPALKLILKLGGSATPDHSNSSSPFVQASNYIIIPDDESFQSTSSSFDKKSKKKKKKKERDSEKHNKKRKHHHKKKRHTFVEYSEDNIDMLEDSSTDAPTLMKCSLSRSFHSSVNDEANLGMQLSDLEQTTSPLQRVLEYIQQQLEKKDKKQIFTWPVTDDIAPGYSLTITQPMDFSTMRQKIVDNCYSSLNEYISDLRLMCNNAMTYNQPDTMHYKAAKRLLHVGLKFLSIDKLRQLAVTFPIINQVPANQLGFQIGPGITLEDYQSNCLDILYESDRKEFWEGSSKRKHCNFVPDNKFEAIPDDLSAAQILESAQKASRMSAEKLAAKHQKTNMSYLKQMSDGSTCLTVFSTDSNFESNIVEEKTISLEQLISKSKHGSGQLHDIKDDRRFISKTVKPLNYNAFGSYTPCVSTSGNLSKEESDLIYETNEEDENTTQYIESVLNFAKDCDYTQTMVDNLLDLLTGGPMCPSVIPSP